MPEDVQISLQGLISMLEGLQNSPDSGVYANKSHLNILKSINTMLSRGDEVTSADADRVLKLCLHYKKDLPSVTHMISIISSLININKTKPFSPPIDFVQSALTVLDFLKILCNEQQAFYQRTLAFEVFMSHPTDALTNLIQCHSTQVIKTILTCMTRSFHGLSGLEVKMEPLILLKLLDILPDPEKGMFVKEGIPVWLTQVVPSLIHYLIMSDDTAKQEQYLQHVELLIQELLAHDYFQYPEWHRMLENICNPEIFPGCIKSLFESGKDYWYRIWILVIKLLKNYITRSYGKFGSPINSMLPVVETAFKRDYAQRVRAFKCWNELTENFSHETDEHTIGKRLKLLIIPLKLNNAKTEDTALAKLMTWWHLIRKFKSKLERYTNDILISFLHFMFGKDPTSAKPIFWAGQLGSSVLRKQCLEAFVEIVGHSDCTGACVTSMPTLNGRILDITMLINNWDHWYYALKVAIKMAAMIYSPGAKANIRCVWKSLVMLIAELPGNNIRSDLFNELVKLLSELIQDCNLYSDLEDIMIDDLMLPLFKDNRIRTLLLSKSREHRPMHKIVTLMTDTTFDRYYKRFPPKEFMDKLKPLATILVAEAGNPLYITWFLEDLPKTDVSLKIWTALVEALSESEKESCLNALKSVMMWPFKSLHTFNDVKRPALAWYTLYNAVNSKLNATGFHDDILEGLPETSGTSKAVNYFTMFAYIVILKHKLLSVEKMKKLESLTSEMADIKDFEEMIPPLVDALVVMLDHVTMSVDESLAQITINCVIHVLRVMIIDMKTASSTDTTEVTIYDKSLLLGSLLRPVTPLFKVNTYSTITTNVVNELKEHIPSLNQGTVLYATIMSSMKTYLSNCSNESVKTEIRYAISLLEKSNEKYTVTKKFTSPNIKEVKKSKKKESSIVNTVVENGEEYVVVKSNWKFNPKNLTEHQKEKLTRKRDIPALYQDLSQSQDEFKLSSWKTDSQDTSLSSSKSSKSVANNDASDILKNMANTDVVPKIMENILADNDNANLQTFDTVQSPVSKDALVEKLTIPKGTKSPRMALKDRVFRNVRNLIEKSSPQNESKNNFNDDIRHLVENIPKSVEEMSIEVTKSPVSKAQINDTIVNSDTQENRNTTDNSNTPHNRMNSDNTVKSAEKMGNSIDVYATPNTKMKRCVMGNFANRDTDPRDVCITPGTKEIETNATNSAPPLLAERPARLKRKPKKYDDTDEFALRNRKVSRSKSQNDSDPGITIAQIHNTNKNYIDDQSQNVVLLESAINKENISNKSQKMNDTDNIVVREEIVKCHDIGEKEVVESQTSEAVVEVIPLKPLELETIEVPDTSSQTTTVVLHEDFRQPVVVVEKMPETLDLIQKCDKIDIPDDNISNKDRRLSLQKSSVKPSVVQNKSNKDNKQEENEVTENKEISDLGTPKKVVKVTTEKSSVRKSSKKSRIEKQLMIETVEGHPFLKVQSEKRMTRKKLTEIENSSRRKNFTEKLHKAKLDATPKTTKRPKSNTPENVMVASPKTSKRPKSNTSENVMDATPKTSKRPESNTPENVVEEACSEDYIESSQDSTSTTISVKCKKNPARLLKVADTKFKKAETQELIKDGEMISSILDESENQESKEDISFPHNKTAEVDKNIINLTANVDTEPMGDDYSDIMNELEATPITVKSEHVVGPETLELADADTQPNDSITNDDDYMDIEAYEVLYTHQPIPSKPQNDPAKEAITEDNDITQSLPAAPLTLANIDNNEVSSPFKDDDQRKQDFLNNTSEISPIKCQSPDRENKSPSPEASRDFVVIKLSSPVHSNGEPFEKNGSPEFFTEDKVSPDKRDVNVSPPRAETSVNNTSPSSSLSLKKRQQVRHSGRAAQMLGLLSVSSEIMKVTKSSERTEPEETKKSNTNTPARRNLRILYSSVGENSDLNELNIGEADENILKLKRALPIVTSSPSGPILKRKLTDIADETTASPASKRKRVSFHDPPVSTTVQVYNYIEPLGIRSPQSSAKKRPEKQMRAGVKSPKRLDNAFNLDSVLSKTVESFDFTSTQTDDTQNVSLDITPAVEIVKTSELNDTDPIFPDLIDCKDPIEVIAVELSSPAMRDLLVKELEGKVETVGDLAKMTELEINRLCIKAPKVKVAKKVLSLYAIKQCTNENVEPVIEEAITESESLPQTMSVEMQTDVLEVSDIEMQTVCRPVETGSTQTDSVPTAHTSAQTDESGSKTTSDIITSCLAERPDFVRELGEKLDESSIQTIAEKLSSDSILDLLTKKCDASMHSVLSFVSNHLCERYGDKNLMLFYIQSLQKHVENNDR